MVVGGQLVAFGYCAYKGDERFYSKMLMPAMRLLDAETAHWLAVKAAKYRLVPRLNKKEYPSLVNSLLVFRS